MADLKQKAAAKKFVDEWTGRGQEDEDCHKFWLSLMQNVLGIEDALTCIDFEKKVKLKGEAAPKRIDGYIARSKVMIEQKSLEIDLDKPQAGHNGQTPFEQAKFYNDNLNLDDKARWIIVSNFREIRIHNMNDVLADPLVILLSDLPEKLSAFDILKVEKKDKIKFEERISVRAGEITGKLYDALIEQYSVKDDETLRSLNQLCVRIVFCLYAEDAGVFLDNQFHDYLESFAPEHIRTALKNLFKMLDTPDSERDPDDEPSLLAFPYVNGGLFADGTIRIPQFNEELKKLLLDEASLGIDWSNISPTIFGAVFESTLNPETRRSGGMHYTSVENIHKVIDPLFLDDLRAELSEILNLKQGAAIQKRVYEFQKKLSELTFLDPACGSGNFLTETYLSLRRLENEALKFMYREQITLDTGDVIKVSIGQFYGIEINDFAVTVAKTALWIAESQMMHETEEIVLQKLDFLPLKTNATIIEGNALRLDWAEIVPPEKLNYIMGNPPFVGFTYMTKSQKDDMASLFKDVKNLDFVCGWYKKASDYIANTEIEVAFVSTNSITQGETVARFWDFMQGDVINYAYRTFVWNSETSEKAHVHCVIISFAKFARERKLIFDGSKVSQAKNINPYLLDGPNILVKSRNTPLCNIPKMVYGNKPADGGHLIIEDDEYDDFIKKSPNAKGMIKPLIGASEYIKGHKRWCLWLVDVSPNEIKQCPAVVERVKKCKEAREASIAEGIRKFAETPTLFAQRTQPTDVDFIVVPRVSSQSRKYVPMGFIKAGTIVTDRVQIIPNATIYDFGIITSNVHMAWMRAVCGRLKSDYNYSKDVVYNNFPWCNPTPEQRAKIEQTAQAILDARAKYPDSSLADLYDETLMPPELRKAHDNNDKAVMKAYGFSPKMSEQEIVAELMKMYLKISNNGDFYGK